MSIKTNIGSRTVKQVYNQYTDLQPICIKPPNNDILSGTKYISITYIHSLLEKLKKSPHKNED